MNESNKPNIVKLILADQSVGEILSLTATVNKDELTGLLTSAGDQAIEKVRLWSAKSLNQSKVNSCLMQGGILEIFRATLPAEDSKRLFEHLCKEVGVKSTQAYRAIAVWRRLGAKLSAELELQSLLVVEALKLLCGKSVPDAALDEAIQIARGGTRVNTNTAKMLISRHSEKTDPESPKPQGRALKRRKKPTTNSKAVGGASLFEFFGKSFCIMLKPATKSKGIDIEAAIRDLIALIDQLKRGDGFRMGT